MIQQENVIPFKIRKELEEKGFKDLKRVLEESEENLVRILGSKEKVKSTK